jgi:hypothetical protein
MMLARIIVIAAHALMTLTIGSLGLKRAKTLGDFFVTADKPGFREVNEAAPTRIGASG